MEQQFTRVQKQLLAWLLEHGGETRSLFAMAARLDVAYSHAWFALRDLERAGVITILGNSGSSLVIKIGNNYSNHACRPSQPKGGSVFANWRHTTHNTQIGGCNMADEYTPLRELAAQHVDYQRPDVPDELKNNLSKWAVRINAIRDQRLRLMQISAIVYEMAQLLQEVNDHRVARGFDRLPVYDPITREEYSGQG